MIFALSYFLASLQVVLCFVSVIAIMKPVHKRHNYKAGLVSWIWASGMLAIGIQSLIDWPQVIEWTVMIEVFTYGVSAGLAVWSGGNIFKVGRLAIKIKKILIAKIKG